MSAFKFNFRATFAVLIGLFIFSCANQRSAQVSDTTFVYSTSACEGSCPVFSVTFSENGKAVFIGYQHTRFIGETTYIFKPSEAAMLFKAIDRIDFDSLDEAYTNTLYDLPEIKLTYQGKSIRYNDDRLVPPRLNELTAEVSRLLRNTGLVE